MSFILENEIIPIFRLFCYIIYKYVCVYIYIHICILTYFQLLYNFALNTLSQLNFPLLPNLLQN